MSCCDRNAIERKVDRLVLVLVLNDGRTWTEARGCALVRLEDNYLGDDPLADGKVVFVIPQGMPRLPELVRRTLRRFGKA